MKTESTADVKVFDDEPNEKVSNGSERLYWAKVAIVGPTGSGKSYLTKTANRKTTGYINTENKPLPYKTEPFVFEGKPKTWSGFIKNLKDYAQNPDITDIIIDSQTMALQRLNREMQTTFSGWDIAKNYNRSAYEYFELMKSIEKDVIVISHDEFVKVDDGTKQKRMTIHNKEYEGKVEEQYTIVLYTGTRVKDNKPEYFLRTFEQDTSTKTPEGLFPDKNGNNLLEIPNDAAYILKSVKAYYTV